MILATESYLKPVVEISLFLFILDDFTDEDSKTLEKIRKSVLIPTKNREERKVRVNKYLQWVRESISIYLSDN